MVFFGAVLTQVSVLGLAATFLPFLAVSHSIGSLAFTLILVVILSQLFTGRKIPRDAVLGFVFVAAIAARILIMQKAPKVEAAEIENLLRGDILFVTTETFWPMVGAFVVGAVPTSSFIRSSPLSPLIPRRRARRATMPGRGTSPSICLRV